MFQLPITTALAAFPSPMGIQRSTNGSAPVPSRRYSPNTSAGRLWGPTDSPIIGGSLTAPVYPTDTVAGAECGAQAASVFPCACAFLDRLVRHLIRNFLQRERDAPALALVHGGDGLSRGTPVERPGVWVLRGLVAPLRSEGGPDAPSWSVGFQPRQRRRNSSPIGTMPRLSRANAEGSGTTPEIVIFWKSALPALAAFALSFTIWK